MSLLEEIRAGRQLRKVPDSEKNDRSTLNATRKDKVAPQSGFSAPSDSSATRAPAPPNVAAQLGNLFANGVPRLRGRTVDTGGGQPAAVRPPPPSSPAQPMAPPPRFAGVPNYSSRTAPPPPPPGPPPVRGPLRNGTSSSGPPPSTRAVPVPNAASKPLQNGPSEVATGRDSKQFVPCAPASNGFSAPPPLIRSRACSVDAPAPFILPSVPASLALAVRPPASIQAPPPPPPPPARRKNSANQRSQRAGFTSDEQGVPLERAANAAPKLIHINSPGSRTSGVAPSVPTSPHGAQPMNVKCHPPPPPPPVSATQTPTVTTLSIDFGRRFKFLSDAELPPPPEAYKGPHTYRTGANRTAPRRPPPMSTGDSLRS